MRSDSFKKFKIDNYNTIFARKWKKAECALDSPNFSCQNLCDVSGLPLPALRQRIKSSLPQPAFDLLHLLIMANVDLSLYCPSPIRYSGKIISTFRTLCRHHDHKEKKQNISEDENFNWITNDFKAGFYLYSLGRFPDSKLCDPQNPTRPIDDHFLRQYTEFVDAIIDDALVRYICTHRIEPISDDKLMHYILNRIQSDECFDAIQKIIPHQGRTKHPLLAKHRICKVAMTSCFPYIYSHHPLIYEDPSHQLWHTPEYLPSALIYFFHSEKAFLLNWTTISKHATSHPLATTPENSIFSHLHDMADALSRSLEPSDSDVATTDFFIDVFAPCLSDSKLQPWYNHEKQILSTLNPVCFESSGIQLAFLNFVNSPYSALKRAFSKATTNYRPKVIPHSDDLYEQIQITHNQLDTITGLCCGILHGDSSDESTASSDEYEGLVLNRSKFRAKTLFPVFSNRTSFFTQDMFQIYNNITRHPSNYSNLWELFCLLLPHTGDIPAFNRSAALEAFNNLSGVVDIALHTGINTKRLNSRPSSFVTRGFGAYQGAIFFSVYDGSEIVLVGHPYELECRGLKTKFIMMNNKILASDIDVSCINHIIDWVYSCLCKSNICTEQLKNFDPYHDIYDFIDTLVYGEECDIFARNEFKRPDISNLI